MASLRSHPLVVGSRVVGPGEAFLGVVLPLYDRQSWPDLAVALQAAGNGDGSPLLQLFDLYVHRHADGSYADTLEADVAISCADQLWPTDLSAYPPLAADASRLAPDFGAANIYSSLTCAVWPVQGAGGQHALHAPGSPPIVVVGSTGDPATPYAWARALSSQLDHGVLLTREGQGHTGYEASACIRSYVDAYLISGIAPRSGTVCAS
jgi:hypothetical protein